MQYPEHEKLKRLYTTSQAQGDFVAWLSGKFDLPVMNLPALLAEYHDIDPDKLEAEKLHMLKGLGAVNKVIREVTEDKEAGDEIPGK